MFFSSLLKLWLIRSFVFRISVIKNSFVFVNIYSLTRTLHCLFFNVQSPELALIKGTFILYHLSSSLSSTFFIFFKFFLKCSFQAVFTAPLSPTAFLFYHILPLLSTLFCIFLSLFYCPYFARQHLGFSPFFIHHIWVFDFYLPKIFFFKNWKNCWAKCEFIKIHNLTNSLFRRWCFKYHHKAPSD